MAWRERAGLGGTGRELLARALVLDPHIKEFWLLPSLVAAVSERVVANDPARGILIWAMAARLGNRARYHPMYAQDVARITAIVDQAREAHGIPVPDVPADLSASDAIAECRKALAALEGVL